MTRTADWVFDRSRIPDPKGRAKRMLEFAGLLRHPASSEAGGALKLTRWQQRVIQRIYGPCNEDGSRQVGTVFILLPRGNRKTALASLLALGHTIGPEQRPGGEGVLAAGSRDQARKAFAEAKRFISMDSRIRSAVNITDSRNRIHHRRSMSVLEAISADGDLQHGGTPSFMLADEMHVWRKYELWSALSTGLAKIPESLCVIITTMGSEEGEAPLFDEMLTYAQRVASGAVVDPSFLPILFQAPDDAPWDDEATWIAANPGLREGGFPDLNGLRREAKLAREIPRLRIEFERLHLNRRPKTGDIGGLFDMSAWDACQAQVKREDFARKPAWLGLDLSKTYDLSAVAICVEGETGPVLFAHGFMPEAAVAKRAAETGLPFWEWVREGWITVTPGEIIDEAVIEAYILKAHEHFDVQEVAFDPKFAGKPAARLIEAADVPMVEHPQRIVTMAPGYLAFQTAVIGRRLQHDGNPVLRWNLTCAATGLTENSLPFVSKKRSRGAVDLVVAAGMAIGRADAGNGAMPLLARDDIDINAFILRK